MNDFHEHCECCDFDEYSAWLVDLLRPPRPCRGAVEQLTRARWVRTTPSHKRDEKRAARRMMRRLGRRFMDDAPRRLPTRGYSD